MSSFASSRDNSSLLTIVKAQIVFLLSTLTEDRYERNQAEIRSLSEQHGLETYVHFLRRLIAASQPRLSSNAPSTSFDTSSALTFRLLAQETQRLARDPFLADRFREAIDKGEGDIFRHFDLIRFCERVNLRPLEKLVLASSIISTSTTRRDLASQAAQLVRVNFDDAIVAICKTPSFDQEDLTPSQLAKLLSHLLSDPPPDSPILDAQQRVTIIASAQSKIGIDMMSPILQKIFPTLSLSPGTSLVQTLCQLGPELTADPETVLALLRRFGVSESSPPRESQVSEILQTLARYAGEGSPLCDVGALVKAICALPSDVDWCNALLQAFDRPERSGVDTATLKLLIAILPNTPRDANTPSIQAFWSDWSNTMYQLHLLDALLSLPNDTFNLVSLPGRRIVTVEDVGNASPTIKSLAANVQGHTWNSLELIETLCRIGDADNADIRQRVREMLDKAVKISAELVHMGLLQVPKPWGATHEEYSKKLLGMFLAGHPNHQLVFMRIWQINREYLTSAFRDYYADSALNITRILDIAQDLKILDELLEVRPFGFALDVAALASRREYLNLDKWLSDHATAHGEAFIHAVIEFLENKVNSELSRLDSNAEHRTMAINPSTITIFIKLLRGLSMSPADAKYFAEVRNLSYTLHPKLLNLTPGSDAESGLTVATFPPNVEQEVESIYSRIYAGDISIDQALDMLRQSKAGTSLHDKDIFACMLHSLFDEYKFFHQYPARELAMTGYMFGSIIQLGLLENVPLGIAIRYVLEAIRSPPDSNLFAFGVEALLRFESRLVEWAPLCSTLLRIPHLHTARPDVAEIIRRALVRAENAASGDNVDSLTEAGIQLPELDPAPLTFSSIQPDDMSADSITEPQPEESEKILFIINNLAPTNFQAKLDEMKERFREDYSRWFANYLVDQRVSTEPNNHGIYLRFLDGLESRRLRTHVLNETYFKSSILLNTEQKPGQAQSASEKTALKNLGSWLGSITLAQNQAIKYRNLAFKELLMEGYDGNRLTKAIPFVCKILEQSAKSLVFLPPNPWLMGVLGLLAELYQFADLRLNLKFEIEVLCKALRVELDKLEATTILRDRAAMIDSGPPFPDFAPGMDSLSIGPYETAGTVEGQHTQMLPLGSSSPTQAQPLTSHVEAIIADISNHTVINPQLASLTVNPGFKRSIQMAIERAVRDIIVPVVERSVTIASISSRELVAKDFATEPNEERMRKAAHLMVQYLAGNLALVTCKEPLRGNMVTHIRHLLNEQGYTEQVVPEHAIMLIVAENIDVACAAIEKAAMERAVAEVDDGFSMAYADRRSHREQRNNQPFWDSSILTSDFIANLPEPLRLQTNGLLDQFRVYSDFDPAARSYAGKVPGIQRQDRPGLTYATQPSSTLFSGPNQGNALGPHQAVERFAQIVNDLERVLDQMPESQSATGLPPSHEINTLIRQVLIVVGQAVDREETALAFSQKVVQLLYKAPTQLGREVYAALLERLCNASAQVSREATEWLLYAEDERKFNVPVTALLLRSNLVPFPEQDAQLAKLILRDMKSSTINFTTNLIRDALLGSAPYATRDRFRLSLEALSRSVQERKSTEAAMRLVEDLQSSKDDAADAAMYDRLAGHYADWVRLYQRSPALEKSFVGWVTQLTAQGILKGEEISSFFYRVCVEASVAIYSELVKNVDQSSALQPVDALARLIVLMIKYNGDAVATKVHYLTKILSIVVVVLAHLHEDNGLNFPQKPFFRLFSSIFSDLNTIESTLHGAYPQLLNALCDTFNTLQPTYFPGFAFSWVALISHRLFMPKLLSQSNKSGWPAFHRLLVSLFKFLAPFIRGGSLQAPSRALFRGAQRFLLVLLHDFPEFLSEYYFTICDMIPSQCIQLRNVVLSAFPPSLTLPDPHIVDIHSELGPIPTILSDYTSFLGDELRSELDYHLVRRGPRLSIETVKAKLVVPVSNPGAERYNTSLINATVLFIGATSVSQSKARTGSSLFSPSDPGPQFIVRLAAELDIEGQHHLMSAVVMHLRYPNAHTQWFSSLTLHLFAEVKGEMFREIVTKVLLERFVVHRPHPWGALLTFIELLRNPEYNFWSCNFVHAVPEITALLESVSHSISRNV